MATPTANSVPTTDVNPASTGLGRYTIGGTKWGAGLGSGVTLTYSFPSLSATYDPFYAGQRGQTEWSGLTTMTSGEKALARQALAAWSNVANIKFVEVSDTRTSVGEIRIAKSSSVPTDEYAHAYYPFDDASAGDVWLQATNFNPAHKSTLHAGGDDFHTLVHELGHALGLKHSFESPNAIPNQLDSYFYSVMSYSARVHGDSGTASFLPTTPMFYDLLGIQALYGRNTRHNATDTTYTYTEGKTYFETIDDAGGTDKIVYAGTKSCTINLNEGTFSALSESIRFDNGTTRATVAIGPRSVIENATGGSGSDVITGNGVANVLSGLSGNDTLIGGAGNDSLYGHAGNDKLTGGSGLDRFIFNVLGSSTNKDVITDFTSVNDAIYLARSAFSKLAVGTIAADHFRLAPAAQDSNDYIVYNKALGALSYDANGSAAGGAVVFATISPNTTLTAADIIIY